LKCRHKDSMKCKTQNLIRKITWFKEKIMESDELKSRFTNEEIRELVERLSSSFLFEKKRQFLKISKISKKKLDFSYFHRFDDELEQINVKKSIGKRTIGQSSSRENAISITLQTEKNEFETSGLSNK
jgi:translation machinery-associated protein 16